MASLKFKKGKACVAIDLGSHSIKFAVGSYYQGKLKVNQLFEERLPQGVYQNGIIQNVSDLADVIRAVLKQHKVKEKHVVITLESAEILKRELTLPCVDDQDMKGLIEYEVAQYLPIDIKTYILQYKVANTFTEGDRKMCQVLLGAMPKEMAESHHKLMVEAGLTPLALDVNGNSLIKFITLIDQHKNQDKIRAYVDFGYSRIEINIIENNVVKFNRVLRLGISGIDEAIAQELNISRLEAEEKRMLFKDDSMLDMKKINDDLIQADMGFGVDSDPDDFKIDQSKLSDSERKKIMAIRHGFDYLNGCLDEVDKVFKYYQSRAVNNQISKIYVYGGVALFKDFSALITDRLDIETVQLTPKSSSDFLIKDDHDDIVKFINALGALVR